MFDLSKLAGPLSVLALLVSAPAAPAAAITPASDAIKARINLAGRQRMLTERMAMNLCLARSGIAPARSVRSLVETVDLFHRTHLGLIDGDVAQNLLAESNESVAKAWQRVDRVWTPLAAIYDRGLGGGHLSPTDFERVNLLTSDMRARTNEMIVQIRSSYASTTGPAGFGTALLLDLYGRQRMLSQKLAKELCLAAQGYDVDKTRTAIGETLTLFEASLNAFLVGLPSAGVPTPPTSEIAIQLAHADEAWQPIRLTALSVASGEAVSPADLRAFASGTDRFLAEMDKAVQLLAKTEAIGS